MCIGNYYVVILLVSEMLTQTCAFMTSDDTPEHKRVIIHVPVVTRTIYKIIDKGHHHLQQHQKHAGEVIHHHHHGGHVAHIHKHEGGGAHKHHHVGTAGHAHKHTGLAGHKHLHAGKGEHAHIHHGHAGHEHLHKGLYGHDHKHVGAFTGSHAHAGTGLHGHGHHPTGHEAFTALGINPVGYLGLSFNPPPPSSVSSSPQQPQQTDWVAVPPASGQPIYPINYSPYAPTWSAQYGAPYPTYYHQDHEMKAKTPSPTFPVYEPVVKYTPESANQYSNVKNQGGGGVTTTYSLQNSKQVVKSEYEQESPKEGKKYRKVTRTKFSPDLFAPTMTNDLMDDTVSTLHHDFDDFADSLEEDSMSTTMPEYESHEFVGFDEAMSNESTEEGGEGAFQSPMKTRVPFAKGRSRAPSTSSFVMPMMLPYEVTEITPYL